MDTLWERTNHYTGFPHDLIKSGYILGRLRCIETGRHVGKL